MKKRQEELFFMFFKKMLSGRGCLAYLLPDGTGRVQDLEGGMFDSVEEWNKHRNGLPGNLLLYYPQPDEDCPIPEVGFKKILK